MSDTYLKSLLQLQIELRKTLNRIENINMEFRGDILDYQTKMVVGVISGMTASLKAFRSGFE